MRCKTGLFSRFVSSTALLLHMDGSNGSTVFTDSSPSSLSVSAVSGAEITTAQSKFGGASANLVSGAHLSVTRQRFAFPADFTVECWFRYDGDSPGDTPTIWDTGELAVWINESSELAVLRYATGPTTLWSASGGSVSSSTWYHAALCRANGVVRLFLDGTQVGGDVTDDAAALTTGDILIGAYPPDVSLYYWSGQIDEFRVLDEAVYTSNFSAPTGPFA